MLDHAKLLQQIQTLSTSLLIQNQPDYDLLKHLWNKIINDPVSATKCLHASAAQQVPTWTEDIRVAPVVASSVANYTAMAVDGSQVYPDRHQGTVCYLLNIGSIAIGYGQQHGVQMQSQPYVFAGNGDDQLRLTPDLVDCRRQEYEMAAGRELYKQKTGDPKLLLFDGSLIFWHLGNHAPELKNHFFAVYTALLEQLHQDKALIAWYISVPKSKDLVNVIRFLLDDDALSAQAQLDQCIDTMLMHTFLPPYHRTIPFASKSTICAEYPAHLAPHFIYLHVGSEIARIELPAWIAQDAAAVDAIAAMILDQTLKGSGYPVVLAEAHEQAVVKGPDRDFFYHVLAKLNVDHERPLHSLSPKSLKKRGIGI